MDDHLEQCSSCGHALAIGPYCVSCGNPTDVLVREDVRETAERAAVPAPPVVPAPPMTAAGTVVPPQPAGPVPALPVYEPPRPARFLLFADESPATSASSPDELEAAPILLSPAPGRRRVAARLGWTAAVIGVVVLLGAGGFLLLDGSGPDSAREPDAPVTSTADSSEGGSEEDDPAAGRPVDVARLTEATPPETAEPSRDVDGNAVRYEAFSMLDGQPDTAWRMAGDGSGREIVFRLAAPTTISRVGLINGYAKVEPGYDGYAANRRITAVEWVFGDGTVVPQTLTDDLAVQSIRIGRIGRIGSVVTDTVTLRIVSVSRPTAGPSGRDYTAISDVALVGAPA